MTDYQDRKQKLSKYHADKYRENPEYFRSLALENYYKNRSAVLEKKKQRYRERHKPKYQIFVSNIGQTHGPYRYLTEICAEFGLPYRTLAVKKYPFKWNGFTFQRK